MNAPAPVVNALTDISETAQSEITKIRRANDAAAQASVMSWWYQHPDFAYPNPCNSEMRRYLIQSAKKLQSFLQKRTSPNEGSPRPSDRLAATL